MRSRFTLLRLLTLTAAGAGLAPVSARSQPAAAKREPAPILSRQQLEALDAHIEKVRREWRIPGVAVAIVQRDSVILAKGYGVRELDQSEPVTERTLFGIGSNGKTFTAALAAMMVDEGKLQWDGPIWKYLPSFRVADPYVSQHATIRDALSHRIGIAGPLAFYYGAPLSPAQLIERLRFIPQETGFRSEFHYSNLMIMVAGEATAAVAGRPWGDLLQERIYQPLGMTESVRSGRRLAGMKEVASAHMTRRDGRLVTVPNIDGESMAPAGALFSTALDMAQFLRLQLGNGVYRGKRLISERSVAQMRTVVIPTGSESPDGRTSYGYGLGWFVGNYRGHRAIWHGGSVDGMLSDLQLLLDDQVGVVVLTNQSSHSMHGALTLHIFDVVLGLPQRDWNGEALARSQRQQEAEAARWRALEAQRGSAPPPLPLERYAGRYADSLLGEITIALEGEQLVARYHPGYIATLEPWQSNTFRLDWRNPSALNPPFATFHQHPASGAVELEVNNVGRFRRRN
jgi:CubicO group peptidase (beta-lactamase class C family)